jgi:heterodisulfide reductase subunit C
MSGETEETFIGGQKTLVVEEKVVLDKEYDPEFVAEIVKYGGRDVKTCHQCGNCTGVCPYSLKTLYKTRNIIKMCQLGLKSLVLQTPWLCATCYRCYEHCPEDINAAEVMIALRHIAVRDGFIPDFIQRVTRNVRQYGQSVAPAREVEVLRVQLELGPLSYAKPRYTKTINEVQYIMRVTGYDKLVPVQDEKPKQKAAGADAGQAAEGEVR